MSRIGYTAMAIGNHEFDNGVDSFVNNFINNVTDNSFPILGCNIDATQEEIIQNKFQCSTTVDFGQVKVGIIGFITQDTPKISKTGKLKFNDVTQVVKAESARLRSEEECDIVIGVGHYGYQNDIDMASQVDLDIIIGGHSHTLLSSNLDLLDENDKTKVAGPYPTVEINSEGRPVPICHSFEYGKYLGHLETVFTKSGRRRIIENQSDFEGNPILLDSSIPQDEEILAELETWKKPVEKMENAEIGETKVFLSGDRNIVRRKESILGNLICDIAAQSQSNRIIDLGPDPESSQFITPQVRLAFYNGGGIRGDIPIGKVN